MPNQLILELTKIILDFIRNKENADNYATQLVLPILLKKIGRFISKKEAIQCADFFINAGATNIPLRVHAIFRQV